MSRQARWTLVALAPLVVSCVLTTSEGPSEPPRHPGAPGLPESPAGPATPHQLEHGPGDGHGHSHEPQEIGARHLLVSYRGAENAAPTIVRSKAEARTRADQALARARAGEDFVKLVAEYSDEPGAAERGGDLGTFKREQMVPRFSEAAFALEPGAISEIVETEFGYHVIQRTE